MVIGWIFGVFFGAIVGFGSKAELDYNKCIKSMDKAKCNEIYHKK